ncbi:uncharacterized protein LOC107469970 [Arachis duranensis]|uniref:Uncharacterized protein LOC107469970 n=1 Tax=Arachis duranensis TaxID=130453 RepID=A0A6P4BXD2_ARADU|nr:uncharacterized protein LOC107469970 [Arachis duranensis]
MPAPLPTLLEDPSTYNSQVVETFSWSPAYSAIKSGKAREWYYTQPEATVINWDMLRREFLEKHFSAEVTDRLRKEISMIIQGESETLYEYWERFNNLLYACPHHMIDKLVLISYFTEGMNPQDKTTLEGASNGSLKKYKTADEAWQLINDLAESTRNHRQRRNHSKAVVEIFSSMETTALTQSIYEMTNLLKEMQLNQQQAQPLPPQQNQQLVPQRVPQTTTSNSSSSYEMARSLAQGQQDMQAQLNSSLNGLTATLQALVSQMDSSLDFAHQPSSSSGIPSQRLPNSKGGINAITLRSRTTLQERNHEELRPPEHDPAEDAVEVEDAKEEEEVQDIVGEEEAQPQNEAPKDVEVTSSALSIPFPQPARKPKKQMKLDPKMVEIFKKVEVIVPLFDVIQQLDAFTGTYSFEIDGRAVKFSLNEAVKHPPEDHSIFQCDIIDETVAEVHQEELEEKYVEQGPSVGILFDNNEKTLPLSPASDDPEPSFE